MPELPEVETIRKQLSKEVVNKKIVAVEYDTPKMLRPSPSEFIQGVTGKVIKGYTRRAKQLFIDLADTTSIAMHLKLNGQVLYRSQGDPEDKYVHIKLVLGDGTEIRFADSRKFAYMQKLNGENEKKKILEKYGPEPLDDLTLDVFQEIVSSSKRRIKDILMDQKKISGIGNIYANDALWVSKIHPMTGSDKLGADEIERLFRAIEDVLRESLQDGGASDNWYRQLHGEKGSYQNHFKVYGKKGDNCAKHPGTKIEYMKVSQRGTFFCPKCQTKV